MRVSHWTLLENTLVLIFFLIPAIIFGYLGATHSAWWLTGFLAWEATIGGSFAEKLNGGRLGSRGMRIFFLEIFALLASFILTLIFLSPETLAH
jgi:hypothetical protein